MTNDTTRKARLRRWVLHGPSIDEGLPAFILGSALYVNLWLITLTVLLALAAGYLAYDVLPRTFAVPVTILLGVWMESSLDKLELNDDR